MNTKTTKMQNAIDNMKSQMITLYHVIKPIDEQNFEIINKTGYFNPSQNALGGQSDGYYFFTTKSGANHHIENMRDTWEKSPKLHAYIVETQINLNDVKYPTWKIDYEAMQDFMFDIIYDAVYGNDIKFDNIQINADNNKITINHDGKFERIKQFNANNHSGLVEKIADYLYKHNQKFKNAYDKLLIDMFDENAKNVELYAIKTTKKYKITKITKIDDEKPIVKTPTISQTDKFFARYGKTRR